MVIAARLIAKALLGYQNNARTANRFVQNVLIYGAGNAGRQLASGLFKQSSMNVVGFVDDNESLRGRIINGLKIYNPMDLEKILVIQNISCVLLAIPAISRTKRIQIIQLLSNFKVAVRTLPNLSYLVSGNVSSDDLRELDIDDLLETESVLPDVNLLYSNTSNKTVLVTGAGGSIGGDLCRQLIKTYPSRLLLVEFSEYSLYQIHQEILSSINKLHNERHIEVIPLLASVCDEFRMQQIMRTWKPETVYHAAAYKHVPLVEHNSAEGLRNNVNGTKLCAELAVENGVKNFVLISTDKVVRPTNIMGASKRLSEMILQALHEEVNNSNASLASYNYFQQTKPATCFSIVRFGNVLGSSGSVVPLFREQIMNGGPISLTHPEITRYFMTITEAAQLVIQAGAMGTGGDVFVLDMGKPVKIYDLAIRMIKLAGQTIKDSQNPHGNIEIKITGLRPGEKLYEELFIGGDPKPTQHPSIMKAKDKFIPWKELLRHLQILNSAIELNDIKVIRNLLTTLVSGYKSTEEVEDWIYIEQARQAVAE
jgi:FlaA1/EpsC-like NDP-sugar epimerase